MSQPLNWPGGVVLLPVLLHHAQQVADFAASLSVTQSTDSAPTDSTTVAVEVPGNGAWDQQMVVRLADSVTYEAVLHLLDLCAARPGQWVAKSEAETAGGFSANLLRNQLGALSKKSRKLFGVAVWPMEYKKERNLYSYRMDPTVAEWWADARQASSHA